MAKAINQKQRGRVRPATGRDPVSAVRLPAKLTAEVDRWAVMQKFDSRSEAIRHLVELGLAAARPAGRRDPHSTSRAKDMATEQVRKLLDPLLPDEEKRTRRHRLIRGSGNVGC